MNEFIARYADEAVMAGLIFLTGSFIKKYLIRIWEKLAGHFFEKRIYKEAAKNEPLKNVNSISESFSMFFSVCFFIIGIGVCSEISDLSTKAEIKEQMVIKNKGLKDCAECTPLIVMKSTKDLQLEIFKMKISGALFIIFSFIVMLNNFSKIVRRHMTYDMQIKFHQDLNKIRPNIEEKEFHELNSLWAFMENAQNYQAIQNRINNIETVLNKNKRDY